MRKTSKRISAKAAFGVGTSLSILFLQSGVAEASQSARESTLFNRAVDPHSSVMAAPHPLLVDAGCPVVVGNHLVVTVTLVAAQSAQTNSPISIQATVGATGSVSPTGCVAITDGTRYCDVVLSGTGGSSTGSCTITEPTPGTVNFSATYSGDSSYTSTSTSRSVTVSVSDPIVAPPMITTTTIPTLPVSTASSLASTGDDFLLPIGVSAVLFVYGAGVLFVRRRKA
jgi:hypothetical protein